MGKLLGLIVGVGLGWASGTPWGLLLVGIGGVFGHLYDLQSQYDLEDHPPPPEPAPPAPPPKRTARTGFIEQVTAIFVHVAMADGDLSRQEVAAIRRFFLDNLACSEGELEQVRLKLHQEREKPTPLDRATAAARGWMSPSERSLLYYALWQVARADKRIAWTVNQELLKIARLLELDPDVAAAMSDPGLAVDPELLGPTPERPSADNAARSDSGAASEPASDPSVEPALEPRPDPYAKLGLTRDATDDEVKRSFRALAQKLHPDKVAQLGPEAVALATQAFSSVSTAYEQIRNERGF
jgi:DnaJ like chaperone protein